ncbi:hypothetical protein G6L37_06525 [Agrobacterium rubi]|nr:hypothetical protein [Agrobacterium rubi]NTF25018.1 hypothetical protein [Agrobacterium rubi]
MTSDDVDWYLAMVDKGHVPILEANGSLDRCAYAQDIHNGPACSTCGWGACLHCDDPDAIPACGDVD